MTVVHLYGLVTKCSTGLSPAFNLCGAGAKSFIKVMSQASFSLNYCYSYENEKNALVVSVVSCQGLPGREPAGPDPYVKLQLLPDKQHKVKTRSVKEWSYVRTLV